MARTSSARPALAEISRGRHATAAVEKPTRQWRNSGAPRRAEQPQSQSTIRNRIARQRASLARHRRAGFSTYLPPAAESDILSSGRIEIVPAGGGGVGRNNRGCRGQAICTVSARPLFPSGVSVAIFPHVWVRLCRFLRTAGSTVFRAAGGALGERAAVFTARIVWNRRLRSETEPSGRRAGSGERVMRKKILGAFAALSAVAGGALAQSPARPVAPTPIGTVGSYDGGMKDSMVRRSSRSMFLRRSGSIPTQRWC